MSINFKEITSKSVPIDAPLRGEDLTLYTRFERLFSNSGVFTMEDEKEKTIKYGRSTYMDTLTSPEMIRFVPRMVSRVLRGSIEPRLVIANTLFKTMNLGKKISVDVGKYSTMEARPQPEGKNWFESSIVLDGGDMIQPVSYEKIGVQFSITKEAAAEDGAFDILRIHIQEAGKALARFKEKRAIDTMLWGGTTVFDNTGATADASPLGYTSGRNITGAFNGSMSLNDLVYLYNFQTMRGYNPDIILMNPLAWMVFATSPDTREIVTNGNVVTSAPTPDGDPSQGFVNPYEPFGYKQNGTGSIEPDDLYGKIGANPWVQTMNPLTATFHVNSKYFPGPLTIVTSPFVKYSDDAGALTDVNTTLPSTEVIMCDSNSTGIFFQAELPSMREFEDFWSESTIYRLGEVYGTELAYQGKAIAIAHGVIIDRNYVFENVNSVTITEPSPTTAPANK